MSQAEVPKVSEHFAKYTPETQGEAWDALWKRQTTPWDRGAHNPALEDALIQRTSALGSPIQESDADSDGKGRRKKALVPGCGRGFDVFLLAEFGYDAYGLEYSPTAVNAAREQAIKIGDGIPVRYPELGRGSVTFVQGDFFKDEWIASAGLEKATTFDLIYDYTFFCALNPVLRPAWALRMSQLLSPSPIGNLICLEFPTFKNPAAGGPPFASPPTAYMEHLSHPGEEVAYDESGKVKMDPLRKSSSRGLERVIHWQPERTHDVGKDDNGNILDWVSIWRRRN